ncbi:hypothetical protein MOX02_29340 [Methylobacterium oxalidis]|uniref:Uncharacterized protein n=1 Tax=Methylobacterium oxalidis TaxID=944322 RepID=A0A512J4K0_9HYPH|nr:hypothetical protein MOX02_29340 [Methylobacterium oxalidis]GLS67027.1 hypothetical protein GCM10007888_54100 [Methylobacterium oxalidis]
MRAPGTRRSSPLGATCEGLTLKVVKWSRRYRRQMGGEGLFTLAGVFPASGLMEAASVRLDQPD